MIHSVTIETVAPRGIAAVRVLVPVGRVPGVFARYLDQVYAAGRSGALTLDGQNVFLYRDGKSEGELDVAFGVGVAAPFDRVGAVEYMTVPTGAVAHTTHHGAYARLGDAHAAIVEWCVAHGRALAGPRWEVYAHQGPDAGQPETDVYYLLSP